MPPEEKPNVINRHEVELMLLLEVPLQFDSYAVSVAEILKAPKWYEFRKRREFDRTFHKRVHIVLSLYARELVSGLK